jgi:hypothetical protein
MSPGITPIFLKVRFKFVEIFEKRTDVQDTTDTTSAESETKLILALLMQIGKFSYK